MTIRVTITKPGVTDAYGIAMVVGTTYTVEENFGLSLISQGRATDTDDFLEERINAPFDEVVYPLDPVGLSADGTSLVSGDGSSFLYGPVTSGAWMKVPSIFRLRITGTGTLQMDSKDSLGNITLATFPLTSYTAETDKIEFPYAGDDAVTIRVTLTGTLTCEVI